MENQTENKILAIHYMGLNFLRPRLDAFSQSPFLPGKNNKPAMWSYDDSILLVATETSLVAIPAKGGAKEINIETGPSTLVLVGATNDNRVSVECVSHEMIPQELGRFQTVGSETFGQFRSLFETDHVPPSVHFIAGERAGSSRSMLEMQQLYGEVCNRSVEQTKMTEITFVNACVDLAIRCNSAVPILYAKHTLRAPFATGKYEKFQAGRILAYLKGLLDEAGVEAPKLA